MSNRIDIGNVRGIKGDKGEKGDIGRTPSYEDLKYQKKDDEFVALLGTGNITQYYVDVNGKLCNKDGYLLDENKNPTTNKGQPFDISEYGYDYKPVWMDEEGHFTNIKGELLDENDEVIYVKSDFISDITAYIYEDEEAYDQLVGDIYPNIVNTLTDTSNIDKYRAFFDEIEGDIKYYICEDNPKTSIYIENGNLVNTCKYYDENGELAVDNTGNYASVPLEKNALYLYNVRHIDDNEIMHYDVYLCTKANTVPKKIISSADFSIDYNVIDDLKVDVEQGAIDEEKDVYLRLFTRGTRGQFYSMNDVDILFDNNVISKLGANNGIAQLNGNGKVPSSQLPAYIDDIVEGTMNSAVTVFTPTDETYIDSVKQKGKIYVDTNSRKTYRWSGSNYVLISNPVVVDDGSTEAFSSTKGTSLETKIGNSTLNTTSKTVTGAINEHESDISSLNNNKEDKSNKTTVWHNESNTLRDAHYPSEKLVKDSLDTKLDITTFNTEKQSLIDNFSVTVDDEWDSTSTNPVQAKIINEKFFDKDAIINLLNSIEIGENGGKLLTVYIDEETGDLVVENDGYVYYTSSEVDTKLSAKENVSNKTTSWNSTVNDTRYPSEKLVKDSLDGKSDINHTHNSLNTQNIVSNSDLNDDMYKSQGIYLCESSSKAQSLSNCPVTNAFGMIVIQTYDTSSKLGFKQILMPYNVADSLNAIYIRNFFDTTWTDWRQIRDSYNSYSKNEVDTALNSKEDKSNKVTSWSSTVDNTRYPTEKLVKDSLDNKIDKSNTPGLVKNDGTIDANIYLTLDDIFGKEDTANKTTSWGATPNSVRYPTEKLVKDSLDEKADKSEIPTKTSDLTNDSGFLIQHQDISGKEDISNKVTSLGSSSTDVQYPSAKVVYTKLNQLKNIVENNKTIYLFGIQDVINYVQTTYHIDIHNSQDYNNTEKTFFSTIAELTTEDEINIIAEFIDYSELDITEETLFAFRSNGEFIDENYDYILWYLDASEDIIRLNPKQTVELTATLSDGTTKSFTIYGKEINKTDSSADVGDNKLP